MASYKKKKNENIDLNLNIDEEEEKKQEEDVFDPNGLEHVVDRVIHGLVGALKIKDEDKLNRPFFKSGDIVCFRAPSRLQKGDFVLYSSHEQFYLRRIIKFAEDNIYVAGDAEREYHIITKEEVIGKAISRQRKNKWLTLTGFAKKKRAYTFRKVNLAALRLGNRVSSYEDDVNNEAYELAMQNIESTRQQEAPAKPQFVINIDLDSDLQSFLNPDDLVKEWEEAERAEAEASEEEAIYVDEYGQPISKEEYEALYQNEESDDSAQDEEELEEEKEETESKEENSDDAEAIGITDDDLE